MKVKILEIIRNGARHHILVDEESGEEIENLMVFKGPKSKALKIMFMSNIKIEKDPEVDKFMEELAEELNAKNGIVGIDN